MSKILNISIFTIYLLGSCASLSITCSASYAQQARFSYTDSNQGSGQELSKGGRSVLKNQEAQEKLSNVDRWTDERNFTQSPDRKDYKKTIDDVVEVEPDNPDLKKKLKARERGRKIQNAGETIKSTTHAVAAPLKGVTSVAGMASSALPPGEVKIGVTAALTGAKVLIVAAQGLGVTLGTIVNAYGRFKEKSQEIASTNEQIIEAATQADIKVQKLSKELSSLLNPVTIRRIFGGRDSAGSQLSASKRLLSLFSPSMYTNTFKDFADKTYITDNKSKKWEKVKLIAKELKDEQKKYDDLIILLEIKILQYTLYEMNNLFNKPITIQKLSNEMNVLINGFNQIEQEIKNTKKGFLNKKKYNNLLKQKTEINKKIDNLKNDIIYYKTHTQSIESIEKDRKEVMSAITRLTNLTNLTNKPDYLKEEEITQSKKKFDALQIQVKSMEDQLGKLNKESEGIKQRLQRLEQLRGQSPR